MNLLSLPSELIILILAYLKARDILAFSRCRRSTRDIVVDSDVLQYLMVMETTGLENSHRSPLQKMSMRDRLTHIQRKEEIWRELRLPDARHWTIPVTHMHSHVHSLSSGLYILGDASPDPQSSRIVGLHYLELPKCGHFQGAKNSLRWTHVALDGEVLNVGLSLEEDDLIAALTASVSSNDPNTQIFKLCLRKFSTWCPHPMARETTIRVCEYSGNDDQRVATITIAGHYLLLLMKSLTPNSLDEFFVYDWTTSLLLKRLPAPSFTYRDVSFLSTDTLLLTNIRENTLELLKLRNVEGTTSSDKELVWVAKLGLPPLRPGRAMVSLSCCTDRIRRGEEVPIASNLPDSNKRPPPSTPLLENNCGDTKYGELGPHCRPDKALVQFRTYIQAADMPADENMVYFSFVAHREVILRHANEGDWKHGVQDKTSISAVPWLAWGPKSTRWGGKDEADAAWMANIAGQRNVVNSGHNPRPICVRDYNIFSVNRTLSSRSLAIGGRKNQQVVVKESTTAHQDCFLEDIHSSLPYVEYTSSAQFSFDAVLICDAYIIGLSESEDGSLNNIDVFLMTPEDPPTCTCCNGCSSSRQIR
ncbi:hypothetical protein SCHPADRAFT_849336 [Schizopora paradoxa]|uniref:F-box domain-containing protein n=1 Tax=Schizopora paradoxa TaxID=27342 RepID=A0A0H2S1G6_9AGAM|nr:hypothetical protein SCHPADRAFT_849336 [Schizopora paradoxa]